MLLLLLTCSAVAALCCIGINKYKVTVQEHDLCKISKWPELTGSVVVLRGMGHTKFCSHPMLILEPVGPLIPFRIEHDALLTLIKQFACIVEQLSVRGYLHGDLSYYNLLQHIDSED